MTVAGFGIAAILLFETAVSFVVSQPTASLLLLFEPRPSAPGERTFHKTIDLWLVNHGAEVALDWVVLLVLPEFFEAESDPSKPWSAAGQFAPPGRLRLDGFRCLSSSKNVEILWGISWHEPDDPTSHISWHSRNGRVVLPDILLSRTSTEIELGVWH